MNLTLGAASPAAILLAIACLAGCSKNHQADILGHWQAESYKLQSLNLPIGPDLVINQQELKALDTAVPIRSIAGSGDEVVLGIAPGVGLSFYFENRDRMYFDVPFAGKIYYDRVSPAPTPSNTNANVLPKPLHDKAATVLATAVVSPTSAPATATLTAGHNAVTTKAPVLLVETRPPLPSAVTPASSSALPTPARLAATAKPILDSGAVLELVRAAEAKLTNNDLDAAQQLLTMAKSQNSSHPLIDYDFAILRMRQADRDAALRHLDDAFKNGFRAVSLLQSDQDLAPLKTDSRYHAILARYQ